MEDEIYYWTPTAEQLDILAAGGVLAVKIFVSHPDPGIWVEPVDPLADDDEPDWCEDAR